MALRANQDWVARAAHCLPSRPRRRRGRIRWHLPSCLTCQRPQPQAAHGGPRGLICPLLILTRSDGTLWVDWNHCHYWMAGLPTTTAGFDMTQTCCRVRCQRGRRPMLRTHKRTSAKCLRSGARFPDVLMVDHDAKFTREVFRAFVEGMGSRLICVSPVYPTPRWSGLTESSAYYGTMPNTARMTGQAVAVRRVRDQQHSIDVRRGGGYDAILPSHRSWRASPPAPVVAARR